MIDPVERDLDLYDIKQTEDDLYADEFERVKADIAEEVQLMVTAVLGEGDHDVMDCLEVLADEYGTNCEEAILRGLSLSCRMTLLPLLIDGKVLPLGERAFLARKIVENFKLDNAVRARIAKESAQAKEEDELKDVD